MRWRRTVGLALAAAAVIAAGCAATDGDADPDLTGHAVEVLAVWQDAEAAAFERVLADFERRTGAAVTFTSTEGEAIATVLQRRLDAGDPPDVALLPQPGLIEQLADAGLLAPIEAIVGDAVRDQWAPAWQELGTVDGELYGLWFKASAKSLIWYSIGAFEAAGVLPPDDLEALHDAMAALRAAGIVPLSVTGASAEDWTLTDWFENLYLRMAGPEAYDALADRRLPWTDPSVVEVLEEMGQLLQPANVVRVDGLATTFAASVAAVFATEPTAAMVMEGDFVPGVVADASTATIGVDVDVFPFPGVAASDRFVVAGGDAAVLMDPTRAGRALVGYLASAEAATVWAELGGFVSPNEAVDLTAYPDATTRRVARSLLEAGADLRFDLSDVQPAAFGATPGEGLWDGLARFIRDPADAAGAAAEIEAAAARAWEE